MLNMFSLVNSIKRQIMVQHHAITVLIEGCGWQYLTKLYLSLFKTLDTYAQGLCLATSASTKFRALNVASLRMGSNKY